MNHNSGVKKAMGTNHDLKSVTIFLDDYGAILAKPKQAFRSTQNAFKKLLWNLKKNY